MQINSALLYVSNPFREKKPAVLLHHCDAQPLVAFIYHWPDQKALVVDFLEVVHYPQKRIRGIRRIVIAEQ